MKKPFVFLPVYFLIFILFFAISCSKPSDTDSIKSNNKTKIAKIDEIIKKYAENAGFNGAVLVAHHGQVIYKKGFGMADMEWEIANTPTTKFRIASVTKPFTAMLIMQLVAENKLDLHKPIGSYLKDFPKRARNQITIHHLLTHTSGLVRDIEKDGKQYHSPKELVDLLASESLQYATGEKFYYSNAGYILLGYILETVTHKSYQELLEENIFEPLHMKNSGYYRHRLLLKGRSSGYTNNFIDYYNVNYMDFSNPFSAGAIYSTVEDMFLFDQAMYTEKIIPKKYLELALTKHAPADFGGHYGYGWEIVKKPIGNTKDMILTIGHSGALPGYCATYTSIPSSQSSIIFLNNTRRAYLNAMTTAVTGILYDKPYDLPKKSISKLLLDKIEKEGIERGIQFFNTFKKDENYYVKEEELNIVSYKLMKLGSYESAAEVLKLGVGYFPNAFNLYDSYGEILLKLGKTADAIKNYKKSINLNPDNKHGIMVLEELGVKIN